MAIIQKSDGMFAVNFKLKGQDVVRYFSEEEDAKIYLWHRNRLDELKNAYDIPINERITLREMVEIKNGESLDKASRTLKQISLAQERTQEQLPQDKRYVHEYTYDDWLNAAKGLYNTEIHRGSVSNKISMSLGTLRRDFAYLSSCYSHIIAKGVKIENMPLKVLQTYINPLLKESKK